MGGIYRNTTLTRKGEDSVSCRIHWNVCKWTPVIKWCFDVSPSEYSKNEAFCLHSIFALRTPWPNQTGLDPDHRQHTSFSVILKQYTWCIFGQLWNDTSSQDAHMLQYLLHFLCGCIKNPRFTKTIPVFYILLHVINQDAFISCAEFRFILS